MPCNNYTIHKPQAEKRHNAYELSMSVRGTLAQTFLLTVVYCSEQKCTRENGKGRVTHTVVELRQD
jgi:hypothetical protein